MVLEEDVACPRLGHHPLLEANYQANRGGRLERSESKGWCRVRSSFTELGLLECVRATRITMARWISSRGVGLWSRVLRQIVRMHRAPQRRMCRDWLPAYARVTTGVFAVLFLWRARRVQTKPV